MAFFVYFVACTSIFFQMGSLTHIPSILIIILYVVIFLFTWIHFIRDPCSFGYFRFSFIHRELAMKHYFVYLFVLTSSVLLLSLLPQYSFAALPPLLLMLIYTLAYRPYQYFKQNLRSAFNLLTMCSFVGFKIFAEMSNKKQLSSTTTTVFLLVNVGVLLPVVLVLSLISSIYYYYYENYILSEEQKMKE